MKDDIRRQTCVVIRKNGEYLVGRIIYSTDLRWSGSPYDAWKTRDMDKARKVALRTGGVTVLFNPVVNRTMIV